MALVSNVLVNGEWRSRTVDIGAVLSHYDQQDQDNANTLTMNDEKTPKFGLLTQSVIRSPLVHWILPVQLRDSKIKDVAFIGDDFVEIKELRPDGFFWDVIRKENFGARIRNAVVIGSVSEYESDPDVIRPFSIKSENGNVNMDIDLDASSDRPAGSTPQVLPPQSIVLQLGTGDTVFLRLQRTSLGQFHFVSSKYRVPKSMLNLQAGMLLAVDPSSRYMAIGCSEGMIYVYQLHTRARLKQDLANGVKPTYVECGVHIPVSDTILKIEFLHPAPGDTSNVLMLLLAVRRGRTRMQLYDWEADDDLGSIQPKGIKGHLLEPSRQLPLLIIPLMVKSAFVMVYESFMSVCSGMTTDSPIFADFSTEFEAPRQVHYGSGAPLWVAWTRPPRLAEYREVVDYIYVVREDGLVKYMTIPDCLEPEENSPGELKKSCGTAFACLDHQRPLDYQKDPSKRNEKDGEFLIIGGDSCSGGTYIIVARENPVLIQPIHNWTPVRDFTSTSVITKPAKSGKWSTSVVRDRIPIIDRLFACAGNGRNGSITELRYGMEGKIGGFGQYQETILQVWAVPTDFHPARDIESSLFLLSLGDHSALLYLDPEAELDELDHAQTKLNLHSRTVAVEFRDTDAVQVTERTITILSKDNVCNYDVSSLPGMKGASIDNAVVEHDIILFTAYIGNTIYLQSVYLGSPTAEMYDGKDLNALTLLSTDISITSMFIGMIGTSKYAIFAQWSETSSRIVYQPLTDNPRWSIDLSSAFEELQTDVGAVVSMTLLPSVNDRVMLLCGTRYGYLLTLELDSMTSEIIEKRCDRLGATRALLTKDKNAERGGYFVNCDSNLYYLLPVGQAESWTRAWLGQPHTISQIWLSDVKNPDFSQPRIDTFAQNQQLQSSASKLGDLLFIVSEKTIHLTELGTLPKAVPRIIPLHGSPTRLIYSHALRLLVVALSVEGCSTLKFIDPDTGLDLAQSFDPKRQIPVEFAQGLGNPHDPILHLSEWPYTKDGKIWNFIIVGTSSGRLLIISTDESASSEEHDIPPHSSPRPRIKYYMRYKIKSVHPTLPINSVVGFPEGLLWCSGTKLNCNVLDQVRKKFVRAAEYELPSEGINIEYSNGVIFVLTKRHSLEMFKLTLDEDNPEGSTIVRTHSDQFTRDTLHHTPLVQSPACTLQLVSDSRGSVAGLWPIHNTKADTLDIIFEADLPNSILKFNSAKCRPMWDPSWTNTSAKALTDTAQNGPRHPGTVGQVETLGMSISGSLSHFTVLPMSTWKYLKFIMDLAIRSPNVCEFDFKDEPMPLVSVVEPGFRMQIDGDLLRCCLEQRHLENLLQIDQGSIETNKIFRRFCELLVEYHGKSFDTKLEPALYIEQAYVDLGYFLRPVI